MWRKPTSRRYEAFDIRRRLTVVRPTAKDVQKPTTRDNDNNRTTPHGTCVHTARMRVLIFFGVFYVRDFTQVSEPRAGIELIENNVFGVCWFRSTAAATTEVYTIRGAGVLTKYRFLRARQNNTPYSHSSHFHARHAPTYTYTACPSCKGSAQCFRTGRPSTWIRLFSSVQGQVTTYDSGKIRYFTNTSVERDPFSNADTINRIEKKIDWFKKTLTYRHQKPTNPYYGKRRHFDALDI